MDEAVVTSVVRSCEKALLDLGPESLAHLTAFIARQVCVCFVCEFVFLHVCCVLCKLCATGF